MTGKTIFLCMKKQDVHTAHLVTQPTQQFTITHPFHPLSGQCFVCVGERYNRYGKRLLLQVDDETVRSIPPQWTDLFSPDPEIVMGEKRAFFRVAGLVELARLVARLRSNDSMETPDGM